MVPLIAAAAVTLIVTTAEDKVSASDGVLSLREAIAAANANTQPHIITFRGNGLGYQLLKSALEIKARGALTINGDANNDGLADVTLWNGYAEKLIIRAGSDVTIIGVDFDYGSGAGKSGVAGASGADGGQGLAGVAGKVSGATVTPPTNGGPGGDGTAGKNGTAGENAAGIIRNFGKLRLVRLGLADGYAIAGGGGNGGPGGWGGHGGGGGDGIGAGDEFCLDHTPIIQKGAIGGPSGDGANGGSGGNGGNAGGAILNEATGKLTLTDVTFGGRLGGWLVAGGSTAIAAFGGRFGPGGDGRDGGTGGDGGDQDYVCSIVNPFVWDPPGATLVNSNWEHFEQSAVGAGGNGGNGGSRGADGHFGKPGEAASAVLNLGTMEGAAALGNVGKATGGVGLTNTPAPYTNGKAGLGGFIGALRDDSFSYCPDIGFYSDPNFTTVALANAPGDYRLDLPDNEGRLPSPGRSTSTATAGQDGTRAVSVTSGRGVTGILNSASGKGSVKTAASLVFVYPLGVRASATGKTLDFNIVRLGRGNEPVVVKWAIQAAASGPSVSPADFGRAALPVGSVSFAALPAGARSDTNNSVKRVSIPIKADNVSEPAEGYRMALISSSKPSVMLGTKLVQGKLSDGSP